MTKPIICAVQGAVAGAGVPLVAMADIVLTSDRAKFVPAYDKIGLTPDGGSSHYLPRVMGERRAKEFLLLGQPLSAEEAVNRGLANRVVEHDKLLPETLALADQPAQDDGWRARHTLELVASNREKGLSDHLTTEANSVAEAICRPNAVKSIRAFLQK